MTQASSRDCITEAFDVNSYFLKYVLSSRFKSSASICHDSTNVCSQPRMPSSQMWPGWLQWYYSWFLFLLAYNKKDLKYGKLEEYLSHVKSRLITYADLKTVCKKPGDEIELCWRGITWSLELGKRVHKILRYEAFNFLSLPFEMQNPQ